MEEEDNFLEIGNIRKIKLEVFERENPEGVKKLEKKIKNKMLKTREEVIELVENTIEDYFKSRKVEEYHPSYIG